MTDKKKLSKGRKPTIVLLHGWGMNSAVWDDLVDVLSTHATCICIDLPGYGDNADIEIAPEQYNLSYLADSVYQGVPKGSILLGWSLGGLVAQKIALDHPEWISGLICIASTPKFEETDTWPGIKAMVLSLFHKQLSDDHAKTLSRFLAIQMQGLADVSERKRAIRQISSRLLSKAQPNKQMLARGLDILSTADLRAQLNNIKVPTLRLYGQKDALIPRKTVEEIQKLHTISRTIVYPKASHAPFVTQLKEVSDDILGFLSNEHLPNK